MKAFLEYFTVAVIAVLMAFAGYWLMGINGGNHRMVIDMNDPCWTIWSSIVSIATWMILYRKYREFRWWVLPLAGLLSPFLGACLFIIPYVLWPFVVIFQFAEIVFPVGAVCGLFISGATLPFRPKHVWL